MVIFRNITESVQRCTKSFLLLFYIGDAVRCPRETAVAPVFCTEGYLWPLRCERNTAITFEAGHCSHLHRYEVTCVLRSFLYMSGNEQENPKRVEDFSYIDNALEGLQTFGRRHETGFKRTL